MKKILMLTTGGDIAGEHTDTGLVPVYTGEQLVSMVPELREYCELECKDIMQLDGTNVQPEDWITIAEEVYDAQEAYDGVIITHGTDTMAYTAAALGDDYNTRALIYCGFLLWCIVGAVVLFMKTWQSENQKISPARCLLWCASLWLWPLLLLPGLFRKRS